MRVSLFDRKVATLAASRKQPTEMGIFAVDAHAHTHTPTTRLQSSGEVQTAVYSVGRAAAAVDQPPSLPHDDQGPCNAARTRVLPSVASNRRVDRRLPAGGPRVAVNLSMRLMSVGQEGGWMLRRRDAGGVSSRPQASDAKTVAADGTRHRRPSATTSVVAATMTRKPPRISRYCFRVGRRPSRVQRPNVWTSSSHIHAVVQGSGDGEANATPSTSPQRLR